MKLEATRRSFLAGAGALLAAPALGSLQERARQARDPRGSPLLVAIYLRGGADFLNMVVPWKDERYQDARPTIALKETDGLVPLDSDFALHPALAPLAPLWSSGQLAPLVCVGSPHQTRSHFDAQDFMERAAPGQREVLSGWLNRYLAATRRADESDLRAIALQTLLPRSMRGEYPSLATPPGLVRELDETTLEEFEDVYAAGEGMQGAAEDAGAVIESGRATIETMRHLKAILKGGDRSAAEAWPRGAFAASLRNVAALANADCGLEVAAVDYPGWDHHIRQGSTDGAQARMLADYAASIAALGNALGPRLDDTLIVTMTEFGRTVAENGNNGSDHGRGGGMLLIGGGVRGGRIHGQWRGLEPKVLADGRDLPVSTDFRDVLAACLASRFGFEAPEGFFPGYEPGALELF